MMNRALGTVDDRRSEEGNVAAEPSAISAVERAVEAAQRIAVERLELIKLEMQESIGRLAKGGGLMLAAGLVIVFGLAGLATALVILLAQHLPLAASIAIVAGGHVIAGIALAIAGAAIAGRKGP
jgi:uncharacterized membrane protein YqjE